MVITETSELDWTSVVANIPKAIARGVESVARSRMRSRVPPVSNLKPFSSINMPKRNMAIPAAISCASGLIQKATNRAPITTGR